MVARRDQDLRRLAAGRQEVNLWQGHGRGLVRLCEAVADFRLAFPNSVPLDRVGHASQAQGIEAKLTAIGGKEPASGGFSFRGGAAPKPGQLESFVNENNDFNALVSIVQVGLDMAPTPAQIATWESDCRHYDAVGRPRLLFQISQHPAAWRRARPRAGRLQKEVAVPPPKRGH